MEDGASRAVAALADGVVEDPIVKMSVLEKFLTKRGLASRTVGKNQAASPSKPTSRRPAPAVFPLWHSYSMRRHGERVSRLHAALRIPEPDYSECLDAYVRRKKPQRLLDLHADAADVSVEYNKITRAMFFEREIVDQPVCDLEENRQQYDEKIRAFAMRDLAVLFNWESSGGSDAEDAVE